VTVAKRLQEIKRKDTELEQLKAELKQKLEVRHKQQVFITVIMRGMSVCLSVPIKAPTRQRVLLHQIHQKLPSVLRTVRARGLLVSLNCIVFEKNTK